MGVFGERVKGILSPCGAHGVRKTLWGVGELSTLDPLGGGNGVAVVLRVGGGSRSALGSMGMGNRMGFLGTALHLASGSRLTGIALMRLLVLKHSEAWIRLAAPACFPVPLSHRERLLVFFFGEMTPCKLPDVVRKCAGGGGIKIKGV